MRIHVTLALLMLAGPVLAESAPDKVYRQQRTRHADIRARAEVASQHPELSDYDVKFAEARIDDDREMKKFESQTRAPGGSAITGPRLKRYNDSLEETLQKLLEYVRR